MNPAEKTAAGGALPQAAAAPSHVSARDAREVQTPDWRTYFFDPGLRFECQRCGACCCGEPGTIYVAPDELAPLAAHLDTTPERLIRAALYPFRDSYSIGEHADGRCLFYEHGCQIYPVRPRQCRSYPFWREHLRSWRRWQVLARHCPGIGRGRLLTRQHVLELVQQSLY